MLFHMMRLMIIVVERIFHTWVVIVAEHWFLERTKKLVINFLVARGFLSVEGLLYILKNDFELQTFEKLYSPFQRHTS